MTLRLHAALFEILLMIVLGLVEFPRRHDLGNDRALELRGFSQFFFEIFRLFFLFRRIIKDHGAVLIADIRALTVDRGWVVEIPKSFQELFIRDLRGINCG